jgi:quercetin dioxygenase-like cupin family protein
MKTNLINDILIQKDAIVSKMLLKNDGGTVTLFAFDGQQSLSKHSAPFDALFLCIEGKFIVTIGAENHSLLKNELLLLPANIPHAVAAEESSKCVLTMIKVNK